MKLSQNPNLRVEDFPGEQDWIGRLFTQLNPFFTAVAQVFDSNIDFATNIRSVTREYVVTTGFQSFSLQWPFKGYTPVDLRVTKATRGSQTEPTILLAAWRYDASQSIVTVTNLVELDSSGVKSMSGRYTFIIRVSI